MVSPPKRQTVNSLPSVVWRSRCRCGVQMEGVALAAGRRGHRQFDGLGQTLSRMLQVNKGIPTRDLVARLF